MNASHRRAVSQDAVLRQPSHEAEELSTDECRVNRKRVRCLMRTMGIEPIYPRRRTTIAGVGHRDWYRR
jgi:hypothetical protein